MRYWYKNFTTMKWEYTDSDVYAKVYQCIQECILWRGENPYNINMGIDYESIFNSNSFLVNQLEEVLEKYRPFFKDIIQTLSKDSAGNVVITLQFWINTSKTNPNKFPNAINANLTYNKGAFDVSVR